MDYAAIQRALAAGGHDPGPIDGRPGIRTTRAIKAFQVAQGLAVDGIPGPDTREALFGVVPSPRSDPGVVPLPPTRPYEGGQWPLQRDCRDYYGDVGLFQVRLRLPYPMRLAWDKKVAVTSISVHEKVHDSAGRVFARVADAYDEAARKRLGLDLFGGSLNVRRMRGGSSYSMHSWGIAIDFDPERNQLSWGRDKARLAQPDAERFWSLWEEEGWVSLGRARDFDWMHVQAARLG